MTSLNFAISFEANAIIETNAVRIDEISIKDEVLGYVFIEKKNDGCVIPFTNAGELPAADCAACATKVLFSKRSTLPKEQIAIADDVSSVGAGALGFIGMIAAAAAAAKKHSGN